MKITVGAYMALLRCAALPQPFRQKDAVEVGVNTNRMATFRASGLLTRAEPDAYEWYISDKAYRLMNEISKLEEQVQ
jgi:hypothetical protein